MSEEPQAVPEYVPNAWKTIAPIELQEYLFAETVAAQKGQTPDAVRDKIRGAMRLQRFNIFNWLMMNGVQIPPVLMSDNIHKPVGEQFPDRTTAK